MDRWIVKRMFAVTVLLLLSLLLTACGYSVEERRAMEQYKEQGKINALQYIREKYGFEADVVDVTCEKGGGSAMDFTPPPTGDVLVRLEKEGKTFSVFIAGDELTSKGMDNYQLEEIQSALEEKLEQVAELDVEALFLCYGYYGVKPSDTKKNGVIPAYYDGGNLAEVMAEQSAAAVVSTINQNQKVTEFEQQAVIEQTGIDIFLFADYDSKEHYDTIEQPYYNIAGHPIESGIEDNMLYLNGYRLLFGSKDEYVNCEKQEIEGMLVITAMPGEVVSLTPADIHPASQWNGRGFLAAEQVFEAYALETASQKVQIFIPVEQLSTKRTRTAEVVIQYLYDGKTSYYTVTGGLTDDGQYLRGSIYTKERSDIRFTVLIDRK